MLGSFGNKRFFAKVGSGFSVGAAEGLAIPAKVFTGDAKPFGFTVKFVECGQVVKHGLLLLYEGGR